VIACYDLSCNPPTYDVVAFLAHAEIERLRRGEESIYLRVLPGPAGGFRRDGLWPYSLEERRRLRDRVLLPLCRLLPSVVSTEVSGSRVGVDDAFGFRQRLISLPAIMSALRVDSRPLRPRGIKPPRWRGLVTFTLREAEHHNLRNSRVDEWVAAARALRQSGYSVIVVRDYVHANETIDDVPTSQAAALDVAARAQLYAQADLNVGICNGPMWMAIFMNAPTLMLRPTTDAAGGCYDGMFYARHGLARGDQLPTSPPHQRLAWEDDSRDNIVRAVREMMEAAG